MKTHVHESGASFLEIMISVVILGAAFAAAVPAVVNAERWSDSRAAYGGNVIQNHMARLQSYVRSDSWYPGQSRYDLNKLKPTTSAYDNTAAPAMQLSQYAGAGVNFSGSYRVYTLNAPSATGPYRVVRENWLWLEPGA